jgi:hypothetical protein
MNKLEILLEALEKSDNMSYNKKDSYFEREAKRAFEKRVEQLFILHYFLKIRPAIKKLVQTNYLNLQNIESLIWEELNVEENDGLVNSEYTWIYKEDIEELIKEYISRVVNDIENQTLKLWE